MRAAILLAAGLSRRFGPRDKLMACVGGRPLVAHGLDRALASDGVRVLLVVARIDARWRRLARRSARVRLVRARAAGRGLAASLRAGLAALRPVEREAWLFLGDMPRASAPTGLRLAPGMVAARPRLDGRPGHPMLVRVPAARAALSRGGAGDADRGLAALLPPGRVAAWDGAPGSLLDIDDAGALRRFRRVGRA